MNYKYITDDGKNYTAIEKIIKRKAYKDYRKANPLKTNGKPKYKKHHSYSLSDETLEAIQIKKQYLAGDITENEYKGYCIRENLKHEN